MRPYFGGLCIAAELLLAYGHAQDGDLLLAGFWVFMAFALLVVLLADRREKDTARDLPPADPPVNVRIRLHDGREIPVDCRYDGVEKGLHRWTVINPPPGRSVSDVRMDNLPGRTVVHVEGEW